MQTIASERLKETLNWWKALSYRREVLMPLTHPYLVGPETKEHIRRWRSFDRIVLDNTIDSLDQRQWFELPSQRESSQFLGAMDGFPCELFEWNRKSRRVYHLPASLQYLLVQGRYGKMRWKDVLWPFESFVLTLEQPLELEDAEGCWSSIDTILVSHVPAAGHGKTLHIRLLRKPSGTMLGVFPEKRRNLIERYVATGDTMRAIRAMNTTVTSIVTDAGGTAQGYRSDQLYTTMERVHNIPQLRDSILIEPKEMRAMFEKLNEGELGPEAQSKLDAMSIASKLVVGFALYMESLSTESFQNMKAPESPRSRGVTGIITSPEYICTVLAKGRLDPARYVETPEWEASSATFKRPHWRRGHKKRERGAGPNAKKTIRVPPILIREDLVPIFGIISGTATWIIDDD